MAVLLGSREPTFRIAPPAWSNAAPEAIDLMSSLGRPGDGWQCDVMHLWCGQRQDGTWAAFECFLWVARQQGKGWCLEARELAGLFVWGERKITHSAHRLKTVNEHFKRVFQLVDGSDDLTRRVKKIIDNNNERSITLMSGAELQFVVRSGGGGGRGESGETFVIDEALELKQQDVESFGPTMLAMPDAQVIYTSTPPVTSDAHIVEVRARSKAGEGRMAGAEWSNPPGTDVNDEPSRARVNPAYGKRVTPERMADMRKLLGEAGFARECISIWPGDQARRWLLFPEVAWEGQERADSEIFGRLVLSVTTQRPERSWTAITTCGRNAAGERHVEWVAYKPGTKWAVPWLLERKTLRPLVLIVDDRDLADQAEEAGLTVYRPTAGDAVSAAAGFLSGLADPDLKARDIVHIGQEELTTAASGAVKRTIGDQWAIDRRDPTVEVSTVVGASLAAWGLVNTRIHPKARGAAAAAVDTGPAPRSAARAPVDVNTARLLEQLARDLSAGGVSG